MIGTESIPQNRRHLYLDGLWSKVSVLTATASAQVCWQMVGFESGELKRHYNFGELWHKDIILFWTKNIKPKNIGRKGLIGHGYFFFMIFLWAFVMILSGTFLNFNIFYNWKIRILIIFWCTVVNLLFPTWCSIIHPKNYNNTLRHRNKYLHSFDCELQLKNIAVTDLFWNNIFEIMLNSC